MDRQNGLQGDANAGAFLARHVSLRGAAAVDLLALALLAAAQATAAPGHLGLQKTPGAPAASRPRTRPAQWWQRSSFSHQIISSTAPAPRLRADLSRPSPPSSAARNQNIRR